MSRKTPTRMTIVLWTVVIAGLAVLQFPGILFYHDVAEPRILGMPFIYGFNAIVWAVLCGVLFFAYKVRWGRPKPDELEAMLGDERGEQ